MEGQGVITIQTRAGSGRIKLGLSGTVEIVIVQTVSNCYCIPPDMWQMAKTFHVTDIVHSNVRFPSPRV